MSLIREIRRDQLTFRIYDSRAAMGKAAARDGAAALRRLLAEKPTVNVIFAAAPSQNETLAALASEPDIDWSRVQAFHMDEYVGFARNHPQSFGKYLDDHIFTLVPFGAVYYLDADNPDAVARYEQLLADNPPDIVFLGIGENAHIAFNDPWVADLEDPALVKKVPLDETCRNQQVHDGCFPSLDDVPTHAYTLTVPALASAKVMICTVPAATKAEAVKNTANQPISADYPATVMRRHPDAVMYCNPDSGKYLLEEDEMKPMRIAIIGQGRSGRDIHGRFLRQTDDPRYKVVAVVDELEERRTYAAEEYPGADIYADYRELFKRDDIDLVVNSTYSYQHYPVTLDLLNHGKNVLCEKPFAQKGEDCRTMIEAAKKNGVRLFVFQQSRLAPYYTKIREIIDSGVLGRIVQVSIHFSGFMRRWDWQCSQRFGGGSLYNTGPHPFDQALDLLDFDPETRIIYSKLDKLNSSGDAEDYAKFLLTAPGKPLIDVEISSCDGYAPWHYRIQAEHGSLKGTIGAIEYKYYIPEDEPERPLILTPLFNDERRPNYCAEKLTWHEEKIQLGGSAFDVGTSRYYDMVYRCLFEGVEPVIRPEQSAMQIAMMEQIHKDNPMEILF